MADYFCTSRNKIAQLRLCCTEVNPQEKRENVWNDPKHIFALQLLNLLGLEYDNIAWINYKSANQQIYIWDQV